jgi:hypothetical protein
MESFATEVLDAICEQYKDDEDLVVSILSYLYHINQTDSKLTSNIEEICEDLGYCPDCSNKTHIILLRRNSRRVRI